MTKHDKQVKKMVDRLDAADSTGDIRLNWDLETELRRIARIEATEPRKENRSA